MNPQDSFPEPKASAREGSSSASGIHKVSPSLSAQLQRATAPAGFPLPLLRTLLLFAHPDDETLALGARLARFHKAYLVHVTDGAPLQGGDAQAHGLTVEDYRAERFHELEAALSLAGVADMRRECFGVPDQQASWQLTALTRRVLTLLRRERPAVLFTHPYEGGHPDHDATAFAARGAVQKLHAVGEPAPVLIEATFYHAGPRGIETGCFLGALAESQPEISWELSDGEQRHKRDMLRCFRTQAATLSYFGIGQERFRIAPAYDFTRPPHAGPTFYDNFSWGMSSGRFCELAADSLQQLGAIAEVPCR